MRRRALVGMLACLVTAGLAAGCGSSSGDDSGGTNGGGDYDIVFIPGVVDDFFHTISLGAEDEAGKLGVSLDEQFPPKYEPATQIPILNAAIAKSPDAILIAATDAEALQAPVEEAVDRGIKVLTFDTGVSDPSVVETHVSSDIEEAGEIVGNELMKLTGDKGPVMYIDHSPGVSFAEKLRAGFTNVVESKPGVELLPIQYFEFDTQKANTIMRTALTSTPDLAGAFVGVANGDQGAIPALEAAGKQDQVKTVAFDAFADTIKLLEQGKVDAVVSVAAHDYGEELIKAAVDSLDGTKPPKEIKPKICVLTAETLDDPANKPCLYEPAEE